MAVQAHERIHRSDRRFSRSRPAAVPAARPDRDERPLWQIVAFLYSSLALFAAALITLVFVVADLAAGSSS